MQFLNISTGGSVFSIFGEKVGGGGVVKIAGGNPISFTGTKFIASVYFKVLTNIGSATLKFLEDSAVVRSLDNINVLNTTLPATFNFTEKVAEITPEVTEGLKPPKISEVKVENLGKKAQL